MSRETFSYTPGEGDRGYRGTGPSWARPEDRAAESIAAAQAAYQRAMTWEAPKGHATWCELQTPPEMRNGRCGPTRLYGSPSYGKAPEYAGFHGSAMSRAGQCSCGKSTVSRHLRKLAAMGAIVTGDSAPILKGVAA